MGISPKKRTKLFFQTYYFGVDILMYSLLVNFTMVNKWTVMAAFTNTNKSDNCIKMSVILKRCLSSFADCLSMLGRVYLPVFS